MTITNEDNMVMMARYPDKYFDLAIVDPPYDFTVGKATYVCKNTAFKERFQRQGGEKDKGGFVVGGNHPNSLNTPPSQEYINELFRVSKNQIIWGANTFSHLLPPSFCWIVWDKNNGASYFSDCELAFSSFKTAVRKFTKNGTARGKIHPTQKPVALYKWLLEKYAKPGDKILDTHLGSGSIAIACHDYGFDLTACELDTDFYEAAMKRIQQHQESTLC